MAHLFFFGRVQDIAGQFEIQVELPDTVSTTDALRDFLNAQYDQSAYFSDRAIRIAINNEFAQEPANISNADEIALMPPVGGG